MKEIEKILNKHLDTTDLEYWPDEVKKDIADEIQSLISQSQIALLEEMPIEKRAIWTYILLPWNISKLEEKAFGEGYNAAKQELIDWRNKKIKELRKENK